MRVLALGWEIEGPGVVRADFPTAESLASFDAVLIDPEPLPELWLRQASLEPDGIWRLYPGRDLGLSRALENLCSARRGELEDLLFRGGGIVGVRVRPPGEGVEIAGNPPRRLDRYAFLPRASLTAGPYHLGFPQGLKFLPRRGRDVTNLDAAHPLYPYLSAFQALGYEAVIAASLGAPLDAFGQVLARTRVGDVVAWDLPVGTGRIVFLPAFPGAHPAEAGELLVPALAALASAPLAAGAPDWLSGYRLPGEEELGRKEEELARERERLAQREEELRAAREGYDALRGLLFPRGVQGLAAAARAALARLGFACSAVEGPGSFTATSPDGDLLVRVALGLFSPVGPEEHRALLLDLDRLQADGGRELRGMLLALAEPRLDPRRRGPQWTDAVRRGCRDHRLVLTSAYDLFRAVSHVLGGGEVAAVRRSLLTTEGEWRWKG